MTEQNHLITINTDALTPPASSGSLWENRAAAYHMYDAPGVPRCSIMVTGYNRLEKTRYCVECILKYTQDIDYELILIDNGSDDDTLEFYQSVECDKKVIIQITKNIGASYAVNIAKKYFTGKYLVIIPNDVYVTDNWLSNLLTCYESDPRVGFAVPVSTNVSNLQNVELNFKDFEDMQKKAAAFNKSDPAKWEERMRLLNVVSILSRPVLDIVGLTDSAFVHDFLEDDLTARIRRAGFRLMLCRDTWVCHDHDVHSTNERDPAAWQASLESGRKIYLEKYHGIDAWDDINNFEFDLLAPLDSVKLNEGSLTILAAEPRCGAPVLEMRNRLHRRGITVAGSSAFTTQARYFYDLQTVADDVACDRIDYIQSAYADNMFDITVFCEPVNIYPTPITLLQRLYNFCKPGGVLLVKIRNTEDYNALLRSSGLGGQYDADLPAGFSLQEVAECLKLFGGHSISVTAEYEYLNEADQKTLMKLLKAINPKANENELARLLTKNYVVKAVKG